jgi:hypothetical protein
MSGGAFDYRDNELFSLQDAVAREIGEIKYGSGKDYAKDTRVIPYMKQICNDLANLANALHALDWFVSGDTCEEKFIQEYEKIYNISHSESGDESC